MRMKRLVITTVSAVMGLVAAFGIGAITKTPHNFNPDIPVVGKGNENFSAVTDAITTNTDTVAENLGGLQISADGKVVGTVFDITSHSSRITIVSPQGYAVVVDSHDGRISGDRLSHYYETTDCSGTAYTAGIIGFNVLNKGTVFVDEATGKIISLRNDKALNSDVIYHSKRSSENGQGEYRLGQCEDTELSYEDGVDYDVPLEGTLYSKYGGVFAVSDLEENDESVTGVPNGSFQMPLKLVQ